MALYDRIGRKVDVLAAGTAVLDASCGTLLQIATDKYHPRPLLRSAPDRATIGAGAQGASGPLKGPSPPGRLGTAGSPRA